jgi:Leucine-rich repeat (LRR) protein
MRLTELRFLSCYHTAITDIGPVSALRNLEEFDCRETLVRDLSPLAGLPLKELRTFAVSPYNERFRQLAATWPQLKTINDIPIGEFFARRDEVGELRKKLPAFPAERQLELVVEKLKSFNPGWDGGLTHHIVEGKLARILLTPPHVVWDISPLAALPDLKELTCHGNPQLADLSPLAGSQLEQLYCQSGGIADLSPLRGVPLEVLVCGDNPIKDLLPLAGMPLTVLLCDNSFVSDLAPLAGCPLEQLSFSSTRASDLSPLTGMPLKYVECGTTRVTSLEALRGKQLTFLGCGQNGIADLAPLAGMPLEELRCHYTQVRDFSPLAGMPLTKLHFSSNDGLSDFSVLAGMPLAELDCRFSAVSDYAPLSGMPLERIAIDFHLLGAHDEEVLRSLPKVTEINSLPAAEFWSQVEQRRRAAAEWKDALTAVSGEQQFTTVRQKLIELHATFAYVPSFSLEPIYADGNLVELSIVVHSGDLTDLRPLCGLTHLRKLSLTGHLPHVRDLSPLYALALEEFHVDSDVVLRSNTPGLRAMPTLRTINGRPAAEYLRRLAEPDRVTAEEVLRLGGKVVVFVPDEPEPQTIEPVDALPAKIRTLDAVDLSYTQVGDEDLACLRPAAGLKALSLDSADRIGDAGIAHLAGLPLHSIDLRNTQVSDAGLPDLLPLPYLAELSLPHTPVTDAGMAVLALLPRLERLVLSNNRISDAGIAQFRGMTSLRVLSIYDTQLTDAGVAHIATLVNLEDLSLSSTAVTDAGLKHLLPLAQLHHLFLERTAISDVGLAHLASLPNLQALFLRETGVSDAGLTHLARAPALQDLFLERTRVTDQGLRQLHAARPLIRIHWDGGVIEPDSAEPAP